MAAKNQYNCKKLFPISKPYGYSPQAVEETIEEYNELILKQKNIIIKMKNENSSLKNEINNLESELKNLQLELSFTDIPSVNDIQEEYIIKKFETNIGSQQEQSTQAAQKSVTPTEPVAQPTSVQGYQYPTQQSQNPQNQEVIDLSSYPDSEKSSSNDEFMSDLDKMLADVMSDPTTQTESVFDLPETNNKIVEQPRPVKNTPIKQEIPSPVESEKKTGSTDDFDDKFKF